MGSHPPRRGEIWRVRLFPAVGDEIRKVRPALVVSPPYVGLLALRIVVPITDWRERFDRMPWMIPLEPTRGTGLSKDSTADCFQVKSISLDRFIERIGRVSAEQLEEVTAGVALCVGVAE